MAILASIAQPVGQEWQQVTSRALRASPWLEAPMASAPMRHSSALRPTAPLTTGVTCSARSTASNSPSSSEAQPSPCSSRQRARTSSGARKQVPELITVVPPTQRPTGSGIAGRPSATVRPESR
jgi:hypothetical protein